MQHQKPTQPGRGPGLAGTLALIVGMVAFVWLTQSPGAWPNAAVNALVHRAGFAWSPVFYAPLGALAICLLTFLPLSIWEGGQTEKRQVRAARKAAKTGMLIDAERARLERERRGRPDTNTFLHRMGEEATARANRATPGFILTLAAGAALIICITKYCLDHY